MANRSQRLGIGKGRHGNRAISQNRTKIFDNRPIPLAAQFRQIIAAKDSPNSGGNFGEMADLMAIDLFFGYYGAMAIWNPQDRFARGGLYRRVVL